MSSPDDDAVPDCLICQKHRGVGPLVCPVVHEDDLIVVTHRATGSLGALFLESRRHVPHLDELTPAEASALGRARTLLAHLLRTELEVELVQSFVSGRDVAHFHEHVVARHAGTPADVEWWQGWDGAPSGDIPAFTSRLKNRFEADPAFGR